MRALRLWIVLVLLLSKESIGATTTTELCRTVQAAITQNHITTRDLTGSMFCEPFKETKEYVVFELRYRRDVEQEGIGSNLVGWYAVRRSDREVFEWDITEETLSRAVQAAKPDILSLLKSMNYAQARENLLHAGWAPRRQDNLSEWDSAANNFKTLGFSEVVSCAGDAPLCRFEFRKKNDCLAITGEYVERDPISDPGRVMGGEYFSCANR